MVTQAIVEAWGISAPTLSSCCLVQVRLMGYSELNLEIYGILVL